MNHTDENNLITIVIDGDQDGKRLDAVLASGSGLSRNHIQQLLKEGCVATADAQIITQPSKRVLEDDVFTIELPPTQSLELTAEDIPLDILFEDEHLLVINKPAGMVVHPSHGHDHGTLVHALQIGRASCRDRV